MHIRRTDGTVADVADAEGRRLIREGNAQAADPATVTVATEAADGDGDDSAGDPKPRKRT